MQCWPASVMVPAFNGEVRLVALLEKHEPAPDLLMTTPEEPGQVDHLPAPN